MADELTPSDFSQGELQEESVVNYWLPTAADGKNYSVAYYHLDAIISVGYRLNSVRGTQFRIWATQQLSELMRKGFVLDKERLKNPPIKGATALPDYFDDLLEQITALDNGLAKCRAYYEDCIRKLNRK